VSGVFVTGTDTGVGKTRVACTLLAALTARGLRAAGMKPVASGCHAGPGGLHSEDAEAMMRHGNVRTGYAVHNPYAFEPAIAPHLAAGGTAIQAAVIETALLDLSRLADVVVVEGVGGWRVPLAPDLDQPALVRRLGLPVVLVVGLRLGCLNHALLTAEAIERSGVSLAGWVANHVDPHMAEVAGNVATLRDAIAAPLLGELPWTEVADARADGARLEMGSVLDGQAKVSLSR